jgi:hypothetical protein
MDSWINDNTFWLYVHLKADCTTTLLISFCYRLFANGIVPCHARFIACAQSICGFKLTA